MQTDDTQIVDSSSANSDVSSASSPVEHNLEALTEAQHYEWRKTGKFPEPKKAESATAQESSGDSPDKAESEPAPAPEAGKQEPPKRKGLKERNAEIEAEVAKLQENLKKRAELRKQVETDDKPAAPSLAKEPPSSEPKAFQSEEEYFKAHPDHSLAQYISAAARHEAQEIIRLDREAAKQAEAKAKAEEAQKSSAERWNKAQQEALKEHTDLAEVIYGEDVQKRMQNELVAGFVLSSENGPKLLYTLGKNAAEFDRILAITDPYMQAREIVKLEQSLSKEKPSVSSKKEISDALPPVREIKGTGNVTADEVEEAVKEGDEAAYIAAANARDLRKARKGK